MVHVPINVHCIFDPGVEPDPGFHCSQGMIGVEHQKQCGYSVVRDRTLLIHFIDRFSERLAEVLVSDVSYLVLILFFFICSISRIDTSFLDLDIRFLVDPVEIDPFSIHQPGLNGVIRIKFSERSPAISSQQFFCFLFGNTPWSL